MAVTICYQRGIFDTRRDPATLIIRSVKAADAGVFRCRVDFKANQTQNTFVTLVVIGESNCLIVTPMSHLMSHLCHIYVTLSSVIFLYNVKHCITDIATSKNLLTAIESQQINAVYPVLKSSSQFSRALDFLSRFPL